MSYTKFVLNALGKHVPEQRGQLVVMPRRARGPRVRRAKCAKVLKFARHGHYQPGTGRT
jgi:hypothetical protein